MRSIGAVIALLALLLPSVAAAYDPDRYRFEAVTVTTTGENSLLVGFWLAGGSRTFTAPGDMNEEYDAGSGPSHMIADSVQAAAGASGNKTAVISSSAAGGAQLIAFRASGT